MKNSVNKMFMSIQEKRELIRKYTEAEERC